MKIQSAKPVFNNRKKILKEIDDIFTSGRLILGKYTNEFETNFKQYIGTDYCVAMSSATACLETIMRYWGVRDKEVIIPTNTFIACSNSVIYAGGIPVFCDTNPETYCMTANDILENITPKTKAVMAVHLAGLPIPDIWEIKKICNDNDLFLIEDCSHAHGAMIDGKKVGSIGDAACFSLYPTKIMTSSLGGMITTNDIKLHNFAKSVRHHGQGHNLNDIIHFGNDFLLDEIHAVIGMQQLEELEDNLAKRQDLAKMYMKNLDQIEGVDYVHVPKNIKHGYYRFLIKLDNSIDKKRIIKMMRDDEIEVETLYSTPLHKQLIYLDRKSIQQYPNTDGALQHQIGLPMHVYLDECVISYITESLSNAISEEIK